MFHKYTVYPWGRDEEDRIGTHVSLPLIFLILLIGACVGWAFCSDSLKVANYNRIAFEAYGKDQERKYTELLERYQRAMCAFRKLEVTTVENTKLCMDPQTKALYKIERDRSDLYPGERLRVLGEAVNRFPE